MATEDLKIGLVVMASGLGKRFGGNKLMEPLEGKPLIQWILDTTDDLFEKRVVVTRSDDVKALCDALSIDCILHELPNRNDTIRLGLSSLMDDIDYCFFTPGDQPLISKESIVKMINEVKNNSDMIIRTSFDSLVGTPVGFPRVFFDELLNLPKKTGGNYIIKKNIELVESVQVKNEYELWDIDTASDLSRVKSIRRVEMD